MYSWVESGGREGACRANGGGGDAGCIKLLLVPAQTYPKLFHLFFLQARGVKIEAWLRDKFRGQGGQDYVDVMPRQTKQEMTEDGRTTLDVGHLPISTLTQQGVCVWWLLHGNVCAPLFKTLISSRFEIFRNPHRRLAVWRECLQGAFMHHSSDRLW